MWFSATIVKILNYYDVDFEATNVLENPNIRIELSKHSNWPTIPQLFVEGELIGGCDIALEMHQQGQLESVLLKELRKNFNYFKQTFSLINLFPQKYYNNISLLGL